MDKETGFSLGDESVQELTVLMFSQLYDYINATGLYGLNGCMQMTPPLWQKVKRS